MDSLTTIENTLYWILSTLPQVIGAMTALLITGMTFFFEILNKEVERDESLSTVVHAIKKIEFVKSIKLLSVSLLAIINDIVLLGLTPYLSEKINCINNICCADYLILAISGLSTLLLNLSAFILLILLLTRVLNPDYQAKVNNSLAHKEKEDISDSDSIAPQDFIEYFIRFEKRVRDLFPDTLPFRRAPLRSLIKQLVNERILNKDDEQIIQNIINKRNIYLHGGDIGRVSNNIIDLLTKYIVLLEDKRKIYDAERGNSRMEEAFRIWIDKNVEDFSEAFELDQAIRYERDYGKFRIAKDGHVLIVYFENARSLYLYNEKAKKQFLDLLESKYSLEHGMSIEDSAAFKHSLNKDD